MSLTVVGKKKGRKKTLSSSSSAVVVAGLIKPNSVLGRKSVMLLFGDGIWEMSCSSLNKNKIKVLAILLSIQKHLNIPFFSYFIILHQ